MLHQEKLNTQLTYSLTHTWVQIGLQNYFGQIRKEFQENNTFIDKMTGRQGTRLRSKKDWQNENPKRQNGWLNNIFIYLLHCIFAEATSD